MTPERAPGAGRDSGAPLRILFATSDEFPLRGTVKAVFVDGLIAAGHRIDWLLQAENEAAPSGDRKVRGGTAFIAKTVDGSSHAARLRRQWLRLRNDLRAFGLLRCGRYSLVQVKDESLGALLTIAAANLYGVPVFYWHAQPRSDAAARRALPAGPRNPLLDRLRRAVGRFLLYRLIAPGSAHVFVDSGEMRLEAARAGVPLAKTTAVPSPADVAAIDAAVRAVRRPRAHTIAHLGTARDTRRLEFLFRVLARVIDEIPDARLEVIGAGGLPEDDARLKAEARRLGVERAVEISRRLPVRAAWRRVRRAAICVSPCEHLPGCPPSCSTTLIEYMALGKAVVANEHPEQTPLMLTSGAGVVCAWDETQFAAALVALLRDPGRAAAMGDAGRRYVVEHRTHDAVANLVAGRYRKALAVRAPGGRRAIPVGRLGRAPD